jgi:hypothetical protein
VSSLIDRNPTFRLSRFKIGMGASPVEVDSNGSHLTGQIYGFTAPSYLVRKQLVANYPIVSNLVRNASHLLAADSRCHAAATGGSASSPSAIQAFSNV